MSKATKPDTTARPAPLGKVPVRRAQAVANSPDALLAYLAALEAPALARAA